jgi:hypothetical protein
VSFAAPKDFDPPSNPTGAQWIFQVAVKAFEANTTALLQTAINTWLLGLQNDLKEYAILDVNYQSGAKEKALVVFGAFVDISTL